ncbi:hypothetical protein [Nocardia sp. NPDC051463]|uniref:hypothetical protein n=1 Tax=Nocardia sp. NPDC051463 TaxID=3154845 RepID=UPI00344D19DC
MEDQRAGLISYEDLASQQLSWTASLANYMVGEVNLAPMQVRGSLGDYQDSQTDHVRD